MAAALTIAGSDPSGGAGIQADLKTFHRFGVYGASAITLITVQNSVGSWRVEVLDASLVSEQIDAVMDDLPIRAVKTGALGSADIIEAVAERAYACPLIVDPVVIGKQGGRLLHAAAIGALKAKLLPRSALVTPNLEEAGLLTGADIASVADMRAAALQIAALGARAVLLKGGHLAGEAVDVLYWEGSFQELRAPRVDTRHTHGTGCTFSAAIAALVASGASIPDAVRRAHAFVQQAIRTNPGLGRGAGPLNHWA